MKTSQKLKRGKKIPLFILIPKATGSTNHLFPFWQKQYFLVAIRDSSKMISKSAAIWSIGGPSKKKKKSPSRLQ